MKWSAGTLNSNKLDLVKFKLQKTQLKKQEMLFSADSRRRSFKEEHKRSFKKISEMNSITKKVKWLQLHAKKLSLKKGIAEKGALRGKRVPIEAEG